MPLKILLPSSYLHGSRFGSDRFGKSTAGTDHEGLRFGGKPFRLTMAKLTVAQTAADSDIMLAGAAAVKPESCFLSEPAAAAAGLACAEAFVLAGWAKRNSSATISVANAGPPSLAIFRCVR